MALQLHIRGPELDLTRSIQDGDAPLVLGRDAECSVCLPDPERNVSRRHLSVWSEGGELHFHVLSVVNGIGMPFGEAPPGARGVLPLGQTLTLAEYSVTVTQAAQPASDDPWAVFDRDASGVAPVPPGIGKAEEDPFGDWGFETTFGSDVIGGALDASSLGPAQDMAAFFRGLGLRPGDVGTLSEGEMESIGRLVRVAVLGLLQLHEWSAGSKDELHAEDRTMLGAVDNNPLKKDWDEATKLRYLFGGRLASASLLAPERAVQGLVLELLAHEAGAAAAARALAEGAIREFEPEALKARLLGGSAKLFESARAWDAFAKHHAEQGADMQRWVQRLLDKYFAEAYVRESLRVKRDTGNRQR